MKPIIKDTLQILAALLITGSAVYANAPTQATPEKASITSEVTAKPTQPETPTEVAPDPTPVETTPTEASITPEVSTTPVVTAPAYEATGNKNDWLTASGISSDNWGYVDYIVSRESGWDPCASYPGVHSCVMTPTNACGLVMQNPCGKIEGDWRDPVAALKWADGYVNSRYGGWAGAVAHWQANSNY